MHPELFRIPFSELTVKSYGTMLVIGFLASVWVIKRLSREFTPRPELVVNAALYALIAGLVGSRIFFVLHHLDEFRGDWLSVFAIWKGGLELLGGALPAIVVIFLYVRHFKLPARKYMDVVAIGLLVALGLGRIGCFLNGCCYGGPTDLPWGVRFPYNSPAYNSQVRPDPARGRSEPYIKLPSRYWYFYRGSEYLRELHELTPAQREAVTTGQYRCLPVHPTQLYASFGALLSALLLYLLWRNAQAAEKTRTRKWYHPKQGQILAMMLMLYGVMRFINEALRDDNPREFAGMTVSQVIAIGMFIGGVVVFIICARMPQWSGVIEVWRTKSRK